MQWSLQTPLSACMSAVMSAGGPIALLSGDGSSPDATMQIFSGVGEVLCAWQWDFGRVRTLGWTPEVELACVLESGRVMMWSLKGARTADFALGEAMDHQGVLQCEFFSDGIVVLTTAFRLFALLSFTKRIIVPLADPRLASPPTAMAVLERNDAPPAERAGGGGGGGSGGSGADAAQPACPDVLLATASRTILLIDQAEAHDQLLASGPFLRLAPSPNGKLVAAFSASGALLVISSDFSRHLSEISTPFTRPPRQLVWCGADSLLLPNDRLLLMVGPSGDSVKYAHASPPLLHPEADGVRIIGHEQAEILQRVPDATERVFLPGSLAPAARLLEASRAFDDGSVRADELLCSLLPAAAPPPAAERKGGGGGGGGAQGGDAPTKGGGEMAQAVVGCIHAARHEPSAEAQKQLLRAAAFGKAYVAAEVDPSLMVTTCASLRVLNALRSPRVGMPITWLEYKALGAPAVLRRLLARHEHLLAWRLAEFLQLAPMQASIALHWAKATIREAPAGVADASLVEQLRPRLRLGATPAAQPRVAAVAAEAHRVGRQGLALSLLDEFGCAAGQAVPLLLTMGELPAALARAVGASDAELIYLVLLHGKAVLPEADYFELLLPQPSAQRLLAAYCRAREPELLKTLYYQSNQPMEAAALAIGEAYRAPTWAQRMRGLSIALQFYEQSTAPACAALARATDEQIKLLDAQRQLERDTRGKPPPPGAPPAIAQRYRFIDASLNETIYKCFAYGQAATAERLRSDAKVPDKRWWRLKLKGLAHARNWGGLWELGSARRSPIGFKPFADACIAQGAFDEAARYAPKLTAAEAVPVWLQIGRLDEARRVAMQHKDKQPELLKLVTDAGLGGAAA